MFVMQSQKTRVDLDSDIGVGGFVRFKTLDDDVQLAVMIKMDATATCGNESQASNLFAIISPVLNAAPIYVPRHLAIGESFSVCDKWISVASDISINS